MPSLEVPEVACSRPGVDMRPALLLLAGAQKALRIDVRPRPMFTYAPALPFLGLVHNPAERPRTFPPV